MKKYLFLLVSIICISNFSYSQNYTYKRTFYEGGVLKLNGEVAIIGDTLVSITTNGISSNMPVLLIGKSSSYKQFKAILPENSDYEIRISITDPFPFANELKKGETAGLVYELVDNFRKSLSVVTYFLIPVEN
jgi:hypothetical protein